MPAENETWARLEASAASRDISPVTRMVSRLFIHSSFHSITITPSESVQAGQSAEAIMGPCPYNKYSRRTALT
jgi:hypothetical protein